MNVHPSLASSLAVRSTLLPETQALTPTCLGIRVPSVSAQVRWAYLGVEVGRVLVYARMTTNDKGSGRAREGT